MNAFEDKNFGSIPYFYMDLASYLTSEIAIKADYRVSTLGGASCFL